MEIFLIKAAQLILAFAILVIIHEFGHFLFARLFGVKVEKFYIFFNPWTSLFKWKPRRYYGFFGKKKRFKGVPEDDDTMTSDCTEAERNRGGKFWSNTEYGIGWLPLGGYCKIAGMIDESMDKEQMSKPAQPWEFRSKPAWQRLLIMVAGVLFNFLLAIIIYAGIVYATGEKYVPFENARMGMVFSEEAHKAGFRDGDIPLSADGDALDFPADARIRMLNAKEVKVLRNRDTVNIRIPDKFIFKIDEEANSPSTIVPFMAYRLPAEISQIMPGEGADKAGMEKGDRIVAVNGKSTPDLFSFLNTVKGHASESVRFTLTRGVNHTDTVSAVAVLSDASKLGIGLETDENHFFDSKDIHYNIFQSVPRGIELGVGKLAAYASSMKMVFTKEGAKSIGGFGAIGSIFPEKWDWIAFWNIAAFLSVALAFMNILPIPALDGGHVLFLLYEVVTRRKPSEKFMEYAQMAGMALLILLLLYANGMDIVRLFK